MTTCELLAPAGNLEKLKIAIRYGADAVYFGGKEFSLRAKAGNLSREEIECAVIYCKKRGVKAYVTVNIFAKNQDLEAIKDHLSFLSRVKPDAIIISDPGILALSKRQAPDIPIHLSTQANTTNYQSALFWQECGVKRINLARELGIDEIRQIKEKISAEVEVFVHGALCISYSGRCMLSLYLTGRDANRGNCAHPCRYSYQLQEEKRPGQFYPVEEDGRGVYIFNSKDLCLIKRLEELIKAGVDSLKIEGRMKGIFYLATVVRAYRATLDAVPKKNTYPSILQRAERELSLISSRQYTENFFYSPPGQRDILYTGPKVGQPFIPVAVVIRGGKRPQLRANHVIMPHDKLEYMDTGLTTTPFSVEAIYNTLTGEKLERALGGDLITIECVPEIDFEAFSLIRKKNI